MTQARIEQLVHDHFDLRPAAILRDLDLFRPIYKKTAAYGHFGREDRDFTWERTDKADALRQAAGLARPQRSSPLLRSLSMRVVTPERPAQPPPAPEPAPRRFPTGLVVLAIVVVSGFLFVGWVRDLIPDLRNPFTTRRSTALGLPCSSRSRTSRTIAPQAAISR